MARVRAKAFEGRVWFDGVDILNVVNEMARRGMTAEALRRAYQDLDNLYRRVEIRNGMG